MASTPGFEPEPHWWEASALTTAPPLQPKEEIILRLRNELYIFFSPTSLGAKYGLDAVTKL